MTTTKTETQGVPRQPPSEPAIRAAMEIAQRVSVLPIYSHELGAYFANIIERHTRSREFVAACYLAREALSTPAVCTDAAKKQRDAALAALEKVLSTVG